MTPTASTTTPTPAAKEGRSTEPAAAPVQNGDTVLVCIDAELWRPLIVSRLWPGNRLSGTLCCEPDDYTRGVFRGAIDRREAPARIEGRPSTMVPVAYGRQLAEGLGLGQWRRR